MHFEHPDLAADPAAARYLKCETVRVAFAATAGSLSSREGANHYAPGDALVTGSDGQRWSVSRVRFEARYEPMPPLAHGTDGAYRSRPLPVWAKRIDTPFTVHRSPGGDLLQAAAGDWLLQYAPADWGVVAGDKFPRVYRPA